MSFINLMANDVWSEVDIVSYTEALLHSEVSKQAELILSRKMIGFSLGLVIPTDQEQVELTAYQIAAYLAQQSGLAARADMALLWDVMDYEKAQARLLEPFVTEPATIIVDEEEIPNPAIAADVAERVNVQALIDGAGVEALALILLRNPSPEPLP